MTRDGQRTTDNGPKKRNLPPWQGRFLFVSGPQLEPGPKTLEVTFGRLALIGRPAQSHVPAGGDGPYFLDLVVLFLVVDFFAPPPLFEADLLLDFFAMALTSFLVRQIYGARKIESMNFFSC
jgi:hypothetical protein